MSGKANSFDVLGTAFSLDRKQILYTESHHILLDNMGQPKSSQVHYRESSGSKIGDKTLTYHANLLMPDYIMRNSRIETWISAKARGELLFIEYYNGHAVSKHTLELDSDRIQIIDAGLNWLIRDRWKQLLKGEELEVDLLALTKARFVTFKMEVTNHDTDSVIITLDPASFFVRLLVDQIELRYNKKTQQLKSFSGVRIPPGIVDKHNLNRKFETYVEYSQAGI